MIRTPHARLLRGLLGDGHVERQQRGQNLAQNFKVEQLVLLWG